MPGAKQKGWGHDNKTPNPKQKNWGLNIRESYFFFDLVFGALFLVFGFSFLNELQPQVLHIFLPFQILR
jgi:hypothetical protein